MFWCDCIKPSASGYRAVLLRQVYQQAQQSFKGVQTYLGPKRPCFDFCSFLLFSAELAVQFRIINRSVPFRFA